MFEFEAASEPLPAKLAVTVCAPLVVNAENVTAAKPEAFVAALNTEVPDGPLRVNETIAPDNAPAGAVVRVNVVLTVNESPTEAVGATVRFASDVTASVPVPLTLKSCDADPPEHKTCPAAAPVLVGENRVCKVPLAVAPVRAKVAVVFHDRPSFETSKPVVA